MSDLSSGLLAGLSCCMIERLGCWLGILSSAYPKVEPLLPPASGVRSRTLIQPPEALARHEPTETRLVSKTVQY